MTQAMLQLQSRNTLSRLARSILALTAAQTLSNKVDKCITQEGQQEKATM